MERARLGPVISCLVKFPEARRVIVSLEANPVSIANVGPPSAELWMGPLGHHHPGKGSVRLRAHMGDVRWFRVSPQGAGVSRKGPIISHPEQAHPSWILRGVFLPVLFNKLNLSLVRLWPLRAGMTKLL